MVQFAPAATLVPQLFANPNEEASAPVTAMLEMASAASPVLVSVTVCDALAAPTVSLPKLRLVADKLTAGPVVSLLTGITNSVTLCDGAVKLMALLVTVTLPSLLMDVWLAEEIW